MWGPPGPHTFCIRKVTRSIVDTTIQETNWNKIMLYSHDRRERLDQITSSLQSGIEGLFCEGRSATARLLSEASQWLLELRRREHWLACDCRGAMAEMPLLSPRQVELGRVVLVRHGKIAHEEACAFHRLRPLQKSGASGVEFALPLLDIFSAAMGDAEHWHLAFRDVLMRLLDRCGYARVTVADTRVRRQGGGSICGSVDVPSHYRRVDSVGDVAVSAGASFADVSCTHPSGLRWLNEHLTRFDHDGIFLGVVDQIDMDKRIVTTTSVARGSLTFRVRDVLRVHSGGGPYWMLGRVTRGKGEAQVVCAYAHPVLSKRLLLPVDGLWERAVAELLVDQMHAMAERKETKQVAGDVHLVKPLIPDAGGHRPDFVFCSDVGVRVIVEAYAHGDDDYRDLRATALGGEEATTVVIDCSKALDRTRIRQQIDEAVVASAEAAKLSSANTKTMQALDEGVEALLNNGLKKSPQTVP